jgi:Effector-associated domain 11
MRLTDKIKNLIADGKTLQAVDMLQTFLKANSKGNELLNQTFLLEGQYKELQKKMQLGLEDATADLNRINYSLLNLCDEAEILVENDEKKAENEEITEGDKTISKTGKILGIVIIVVALVVFGAVYFINKSEDSTNRGKATETEVLPSLSPKPVSSKNWAAIEPVLNVNDRYYGNFKITISSITSESFDGERDRITLTLNDNCVETSTGSCMANYLKFRLTVAKDKVLEPESDKAFAIQSVKTTREETVSFVVSKSVKSGMLDIFYVDKPKSKATTKIFK